MTASNTAGKTIRFRIKRQDGPESPPYWDEFDVPYKPKLNVISCLQWIAAHPRNANGRDVAPVAWECNCLEEICGACTMLINGRVRQACSALIDQLPETAAGRTVVLEPMTKFPVIRDLWVDRQRMFEALKKIKGWIPIDGTHAVGPGPTEPPDQADLRYVLSKCMTCGCCLEACPQFALDNNFIGAAAVSQVRYFNRHETGKTLQPARLDALMGPGGLSDCGNAQNCVEVCPKAIPLTESIADLGRQITIHAIKEFFAGK